MTRISVYLSRQNGQLTLDQNSGGDLVPVLSVAGTIDVIGKGRPEQPPRVETDHHRVGFQGEGFRGTVTVEPLTPTCMKASCTWICEHSLAADEIRWGCLGHFPTADTLDNHYRLRKLEGEQLNGALTPVLLRSELAGHHLSVVGSRWLPVHAFQKKAGEVDMTFWLDHGLAHPRFSFEGPQYRNWNNAYQWSATAQLDFDLFIQSSPQPRPLLIPGRFPKRHRAVFSITDHADHDSCERVDALWYGSSRTPDASRKSGFVGLSLPFTKSVFTATPEADGPGLHNPKFTEVCRAGHESGIEICPHGIHSAVQPKVSEIESLLRPFEEFQPKTWIDHGNRFLSNYGRRGWDPNDEYSLHPWLDRLGIRYVWGRVDFGHALPQEQLDQLNVSQFSGRSYLRDLPSNTRRALKAKRPWAVLHGMSVLAYQLIPEKTMLQFFLAQRRIQRVMQADVTAIPGAMWQSGRITAALLLPPGVNDLWHHLKGAREEILRMPIFFPEHYSVQQQQTPRWLFNTLAIHDVEKAYSGAVIDRLIDDYGIHLSHTYLTSISRAHLSHAIEPDGDGHWRITPQFDENLQGLAERRNAGRLWVAAMAEIGDFWSALRRVKLSIHGEDQWTFDSGPGDSPIDLQIGIVSDRPTTCLINGQPVKSEALNDRVALTSAEQASHQIVVQAR